MGADLILPGAGAVGIRALVSGEDVDQDAGIPVVINGALAITSTAVAGEGDILAGQAAMELGNTRGLCADEA